ncbi:aminotransferase class V-fold PLP-dependent enzyme [Cellulosilyticum sp. I15G10I2]|uniref:aminotransferase class V-fold PLP-dependent enzyme n=1 Tax=Cellulosilyticum sp. I15G10I2 TaxID=1892843 RepID=UPI003FA4B9A6
MEHHTVLNLEQEGFDVCYLPVDSSGLINPENIKEAIKPNTVLISVMFANNEIGTIQPIAKIGKIAKEKGVSFHTDAVRAEGSVKINVEEMNIDLLSLSAHKL